MNINKLVDECYSISKSKGWWDNGRTFPESCMMIITELAEAVQEDRKYNRNKMAEELADVAIRLFDLIGYLGIDLEKEISKKMDINKDRPFKHNRKY